MLKYYREANGDYLVVDIDTKRVYFNLPTSYEGRAAVIANLPESVATCLISESYLAQCVEVTLSDVPAEWLRGLTPTFSSDSGDSRKE